MNQEYREMEKQFDHKSRETIERERVAAQAKYDHMTPEEREAIDQDAEERREQLPWHPDHGNAPQHSMSDTPVPNTRDVRRF